MGISSIGLLSEISNFIKLFALCHTLCRRNCRNNPLIVTQPTNQAGENNLCSFGDSVTCDNCKTGSSFTTETLSEVMVYPSLVCNLIGFINDKIFEPKNGVDIFDLGLFVVGIIVDVVVRYIKSFIKYLNFRIEAVRKLREKGVPESCLCTQIHLL